MVLPTRMGGSEKKERMALMEAAISSSLEHPNLVKTFTYTLAPLRDLGATINSSRSSPASPAAAAAPVVAATAPADGSSGSGSSAHPSSAVATAFEVRIVPCTHT